MRFSKAHITLGVSAALILGLPTYLYADQHLGVRMAIAVPRTAAYREAKRSVGAPHKQGNVMQQDGHAAYDHSNGSHAEADFDLKQKMVKGGEDISVDCKVNGVTWTQTIDSEDGHFDMNGVQIQLKPNNKVIFNGREYADTDKALGEAIKNSGKLGDGHWAHLACAHAELSHFASSATSKSSNVSKTIGNVVSTAAGVLGTVMMFF